MSPGGEGGGPRGGGVDGRGASGDVRSMTDASSSAADSGRGDVRSMTLEPGDATRAAVCAQVASCAATAAKLPAKPQSRSHS